MGNLEHALKYAAVYGFAVFPVGANTKKPLTPHGCKDAKKDAGAIRMWWTRFPDASIGIATGQASNLVVIDEDIDAEKDVDGTLSMRQWEKSHGELPETVTAITGRGGVHLYYRYEGSDIGNRAGLLEGVDVRGEGGYVIAPPSIHPNGTEYQWEAGPDEIELAPLNEKVRELLGAGSDTRQAKHYVAPSVINNGERNDQLYRMACSLQAQGYPDAAILAAVKSTNTEKCETPLEDREVETLVKSALTHRKGEMKVTSGAGEWHEPKIQYQMKDGTTTDKPAQTIANAEEAIQYDRELFGHIWYNELALTPYVYGSLPWKQNKGWREWDNTDDSNLRGYIEKGYGLKNAEKTMDALNNVVHRLPINPVKELLNGCFERWDGNKHIENLLPNFLGAEKNEYTISVMHLFMQGAIMRAFYPGCKFDYMLVLVGEQGSYKSTFLRLLAMDDRWFNDNFSTLDGTRAVENLRGMWMVEMAELQATKRTKDVETIKAFITSRSDTYRPPYGRRTEQRPRRCVLAGTSNITDFLTDQTGNRRFLPITCGVGPKAVERLLDHEQDVRFEMAQAWGEAMNIFHENGDRSSLYLPKEIERQALEAQAQYMEEDPNIGIIQNWLDNHAPDRVCIIMIWREALKHLYEDPTRKQVNELHNMMRNSITGWTYIGKQSVADYGIQRAYKRQNERIVNDDIGEIPFD